MTLTIDRFATGDEGTQGKATLDSAGAWCALELPWRNDAEDISCIPAGTYKAVLLPSEHFHRDLYHVLTVRDRSAIEIHSGNYAGDKAKGLRSDVTGCIMLGHALGHLYGCAQLALIASREALSEFMAMTHGDEVTVVIGWSCPSPEVAT